MKLNESHIASVRHTVRVENRAFVGDVELTLHGNDTISAHGQDVRINGFGVEARGEFKLYPAVTVSSTDRSEVRAPEWRLDGRLSMPLRIARKDRGKPTDTMREHFVAACRIAIASALEGDEGLIRVAQAKAHFHALGLRSAEHHVERLHEEWSEAVVDREKESEEYARAVLALEDLLFKIEAQAQAESRHEEDGR